MLGVCWAVGATAHGLRAQGAPEVLLDGRRLGLGPSIEGGVAPSVDFATVAVEKAPLERVARAVGPAVQGLRAQGAPNMRYGLATRGGPAGS